MEVKNDLRVIGLMSGTSLDGLDLAYCHFYKNSKAWEFELLASKSVDYSSSQQKKLKNSIHLSADDLLHLDIQYGEWLGEQVVAFIKEHSIAVDFISSHGHTVFHQPERKITQQIGNGQALANSAKLPVICDFRSLDVLIGGQGAPLVPIGDQELFGQFDFCLNLGGISNVSFVEKGKRIAYDIGPANMLLNHLTQKLGLNYDGGGRLARGAKPNADLLNQLNQLEFYQLPYPKSLAYEWFLSTLQPLIDNFDCSIPDKLCTSNHHIAHCIATELLKQDIKGATLLVSGGGAKNTFLIELLSSKLLPDIKVIIPDTSIIEFKEAIIFGLMGVKRLHGEVNCLRSVTGARRDTSAGRIFKPIL